MSGAEFKYLIQNLNVNKYRGKIAPHKAILLLTVIELIEQGLLNSPYVPLTDELEQIFKYTWRKYVPIGSPFSCNLNYPFYHLSSSPFWRLEKFPTYQPRKEYSMAALKGSFSGATISKELFDLLKCPDYRAEIKELLKTVYLSDSHNNLNNISSLLLLLVSTFIVA